MKSERIANTTVVIRSIGERTEANCRALIASQVPEEHIVTIREHPFTTAVKKAFEVGLECGRRWTLCLDADVLLRSESVKNLLVIAEHTEKHVFEIQGNVFDKLFGGPKPAGNHLYRTALLARALDCLPPPGLSMRPETYMIKRMAESGFPWIQQDLVVGLHDYEQYYKDIYRKAIVHTRKHGCHISHLEAFWRRLADEDPDYRVALWGLRAGQIFDGHVELDVQQFPQEIDGLLYIQGWQEKDAMPATQFSGADIQRLLETSEPSSEYWSCYELMHSHPNATTGKMRWPGIVPHRIGKGLQRIGGKLQAWSENFIQKKRDYEISHKQ